MRPSAFTLAVILVVAALLRFVALGAGIPFNIGVDEPEIMSRVVHMMRTGDFNPHSSTTPASISTCSSASPSCASWPGPHSASGAPSTRSTPRISTSGDAPYGAHGHAHGPARLPHRHAVGRAARALAAGLMAVMPLHVRESHYVLTDVPVTFFVTLTLLLTLNAHERERAGALPGRAPRPDSPRRRSTRAGCRSSCRSSPSG